MKVNELMVSDLVYNHRNWICSIVEIHKDSAVIIAKHYGEEEFKLDDLRPISLTPGILEKIGFETQPNIGYIIDDWDGTQIIYDSWNHNLRIIKNYKVCLDIETFDDIAVHELQHALKLCGIEREIKL